MNNAITVHVTTYRRGCRIPHSLRRYGYGLTPRAAKMAGPTGADVSKYTRAIRVSDGGVEGETIAGKICVRFLNSLGNVQVVRHLTAGRWASAIAEAFANPIPLGGCAECGSRDGHHPECDRDDADLYFAAGATP